MAVFVAGQKYSKREFRRYLYSNKGIFKRIQLAFKASGPHLQRADKDNIIQGDTLGTELAFFNFNAEPEQIKAYEDLVKQDEELAYEYLLVITNSIGIWKKDVEVLEMFLGMLKEEEKELSYEQRTIIKAENLKEHIPVALKKHFPEVYMKLKSDLNNMDNFLVDLNVALEKIKDLSKKIEAYLYSLKHERHLGFLF